MRSPSLPSCGWPRSGWRPRPVRCRGVAFRLCARDCRGAGAADGPAGVVRGCLAARDVGAVRGGVPVLDRVVEHGVRVRRTHVAPSPGLAEPARELRCRGSPERPSRSSIGHVSGGGVAQWSERSAYIRLVPGSNPGSPTTRAGTEDGRPCSTLGGPRPCARARSPVPARPSAAHGRVTRRTHVQPQRRPSGTARDRARPRRARCVAAAHARLPDAPRDDGHRARGPHRGHPAGGRGAAGPGVDRRSHRGDHGGHRGWRARQRRRHRG